MAEVTLVRFQPWHRKLIKAGQYYDQPNLDPETRAYIYRQVEGTTLLIDGEIAAILGVCPLWPGVAEVTMIPSDLFYKHLKTCVKYTRKLIAIAAETFNLHRIQGTCLASNPKHARFLQVCGLQYEGNLRGYGPAGEDFLMYAYVRVK